MSRIIQFFKTVYVYIWRRLKASKGNIHLDETSAKLHKVPFTNMKIFLRPTESDMGRVNEFVDSIYFQRNYLHAKVLSKKPTVLIDIGANIGSSSISLKKEFPSLKKIIAIEAEAGNFGVLKKNFELWGAEFPDVEFLPVHAVASASSNDKIVELDTLNDLTGMNSASGTFRFAPSEAGEANEGVSAALGLNELMKQIGTDHVVICKLDIEGGEETLLKRNTEWLSRIAFLTAEVHDRFHEELMNSSKSLVKVLYDHDFAIVPEKDVLHCFSRKLLS